MVLLGCDMIKSGELYVPCCITLGWTHAPVGPNMHSQSFTDLLMSLATKSAARTISGVPSLQRSRILAWVPELGNHCYDSCVVHSTDMPTTDYASSIGILYTSKGLDVQKGKGANMFFLHQTISLGERATLAVSIAIKQLKSTSRFGIMTNMQT
jgi:hypothetical protein